MRIIDRKIIIFKKELFEDIDSMTQKYRDAALSQALVTAADALTSDSDEILDGMVLGRRLEYRHARVRKILRAFIVQHPLTHFDDEGHVIDAQAGTDSSDELSQKHVYIYEVNPRRGLSGETVEVLATHIHEYLVRATLFDWYNLNGDWRQAQAFGNIEQMEEDLKDSLLDGKVVFHERVDYCPPYKVR